VITAAEARELEIAATMATKQKAIRVDDFRVISSLLDVGGERKSVDFPVVEIPWRES
jgi:hypothetical protein